MSVKFIVSCSNEFYDMLIVKYYDITRQKKTKTIYLFFSYGDLTYSVLKFRITYVFKFCRLFTLAVRNIIQEYGQLNSNKQIIF